MSVNYRLTAAGDPVAPGMRHQFRDVAAAVACCLAPADASD